MLESKIKSFYTETLKERICQGDIFRNISFGVFSNEGDEYSIDLKYLVVMSQDCDLSEDHKIRANEKATNFDKKLLTILVCPAYPSENFIKGEHITGVKMSDFDGPRGQEKWLNKIKDDQHHRYHFLPQVDEKFPDLVIDFKHFHTIPVELLYESFKSNYLLTVNELFRERLSQRFANFLSRFGLPEL